MQPVTKGHRNSLLCLKGLQTKTFATDPEECKPTASVCCVLKGCRRCTVCLRCTESDIFSYLLQPQTIQAYKKFSHVPKIDDVPISKVQPLSCVKVHCTTGGRNVKVSPRDHGWQNLLTNIIVNLPCCLKKQRCLVIKREKKFLYSKNVFE